jgi:hypothetical protein
MLNYIKEELKEYRHFEGTVTSIFRVEEYDKQETSMEQIARTLKSHIHGVFKTTIP